jgi:O-methyltransferase involved in polyketide biosynthesis
MNEDIIRMAREAGISESHAQGMQGFLERFAFLVAAVERNKLAAWMIERGYATGHGDSTEDLLKELEWQIAEREREACAKVAEEPYEFTSEESHRIAAAIRSRGNT